MNCDGIPAHLTALPGNVTVHRAAVDVQQRARIAALASDFPRLWQDPNTPDRERKRMVRLLLADVTLIRGKRIAVHVRFNGGATKRWTCRDR